MEKILISACLLGDKCRYDGGDNYFPLVEELQKHYELIAFCPEMAANLGCPRAKAEIKNDRVLTEDGRDVTEAYKSAAEQAVRLCDFLGIRIAILKDKSPACGCRHIHNGMFMGNTIEGLGITAAALIKAGVKVYAETDALNFLLPNNGEKKESTGRYKSYDKKKASAGVKTHRDSSSYSKKKDYSSKDKKPYEKKSYGDKPSFKKDDGHKPFKKKSYDRPKFEKKDGDKPYKKKFDRPKYERKDGEKSTYHKDNEHKSYSNKGGNAYHKERSFSRNKAMRNGTSSYKKSSYNGKKSYNRKPRNEEK